MRSSAKAQAALLMVRTGDWVPEVREAADRRLAEIPAGTVLELFPLLDQLAMGRYRCEGLRVFCLQRLDTQVLKSASRRDDGRSRRAAWRMLIERGETESDDLLDRAAVDLDAGVRHLAAAELLADPGLPEYDRAIDTLLADPMGSLASRGLAAAVKRDGATAIEKAMRHKSSSVRRNAIDWARVLDFDIRSRLLKDLQADPSDKRAMVGLMAVDDPRDLDRVIEWIDQGTPSIRARAIDSSRGTIQRPAGSLQSKRSRRTRRVG